MLNSILQYCSTTSLVLLLFLCSCKKNKNESANNTADFSPLSVGSTWTYESDTRQSYTLTVTDRDTVANGRTYKVLSNSNGPNYYRARQGNDYYHFGTIPVISANGFEEIYLKDNQDVNAFWQTAQTFSMPGIPLPLVANLKYTIREKGISRIVKNKQYNEVIHVRMDVSVTGFGSIGSGDFYYAKNVGLIESSIAITAAGQQFVNANEVLSSYNIK